jgi:phenylalanyl-tRNA synthetase beta chain
MKVPLKWLEDYVPLTVPVAELAERLTLAGLEVSGAEVYGLPRPEGLRVKSGADRPVWDRDRIMIARVVEVRPHPDADRLKLPTVEYGGGRSKTMVTGATNLQPGDRGQTVILALSGSRLIDGHSPGREIKELKPAKIRGQPSDAMLCSALELGLGEDHAGIMLLDEDVAIGTPLADLMGDVVLELEITPNMARCLSLIGVAREVAALTGQSVKLPPHQVKAEGPPVEGMVSVRIEDPKLCPRYSAALLENVRTGTAPAWMRRRLSYAGMRPISNVVDVTNYVMLEWGQPLHAFDHDALRRRAGGKAPVITVRLARKGETLKTLDGVDRTLTPDMLVIADEAGPVALAGVMGGAETEVSDTTTRVLLESASFDFVSVRRTVRALELPSEASTRFSKGVPADSVRPASERACELMRLYAGATVYRGLADCYPAPRPPQVVELRMSEVRRILGVELPREECTRLLRTLEFTVEEHGPDALRVTVPPHRLDVQEGPADLIEDLARLHGYDRLPATLLAEPLPPQVGNPSLEFEERVGDRLVAAGLQEVITYSLTTPAREAPLGLPQADYVELANPISAERTVMRHSLLSEMLPVLRRNLDHGDDVRLFEIGSLYLPRKGQKLPDEPRKLGLVLCGRRGVEHWEEPGAPRPALDFFDLKGVVEALVEDLHLAGVGYRPARDWPALHPGKAAELVLGDRPAGRFGEMHPRAAAAFGLGGKAVLVGEFDLVALRSAVPPGRELFRPVPEYPAALRDVAVVVAEDVPASRVEEVIRQAGEETARAGVPLVGVRLFDVYRGDSIPAGTKSLAYALSYQSAAKTLTEKEIDQAHKKVEGRLRHALDARIRGEEARKPGGARGGS